MSKKLEVSKADFFIICDPTKAEASVGVLSGLITAAGFECETSIEKKGVREHAGAKYIVIYLTSQCLRDKNLVNKVELAMTKKKCCVLYEADKDRGAVFSKGDLAVVDLQAIVKDPKAIPKARQRLQDVSAIPFRINSPFADFALKRIFHSLCIKDLPETAFPIFQEIGLSQEMRDSVKQVFEDLGKSPPKTKISFLGFQSLTSEQQFINKFRDDFETAKILEISEQVLSGIDTQEVQDQLKAAKRFALFHLFDQTNKTSCSAKAALENISRQLFHVLPEFQRKFSLPGYSVEENFNLLFLQPCAKMKGKKMFLFLRRVDDGNIAEVKSLIHLLQSASLPKWIRIFVTCSNEFASENALNHPLIHASTETGEGQKEEDKVSFDKDVEILTEALPASVDVKLLLSTLASCRFPLDESTVAKVMNTEAEAIFKAVENSPLIYITQHLEQKYMKIASAVVANLVAEEYGETLMTAKHNLLDSFVHVCEDACGSIEHQPLGVKSAFRELLHLCLETKSCSLALEKLSRFSWLVPRVRNGVLSFMEDLKEAHQRLMNTDGNEDIKSWVLLLFTFLQQCYGVLYRDWRETPSQLLGRLQLDDYDTNSQTYKHLKKLLHEASEFKLGDGSKSFLPLTPSLSSSVTLVEKVAFDRFVKNDPFTKVVICKNLNCEDGSKYIACGTDDGQLILYNADEFNFSKMKVFSFHKKEITSISQKGNLVLTTAEDCRAVLFTLATGEILYEFIKSENPFIGGGFSETQPLTIFLCSQQNLQIWSKVETEDAKISFKMKASKSLNRAQTVCPLFSEGICAVGNEIGKLTLYSFDGESLDSKECPEGGHSRGITALGTHPDVPDVLVSGGFDRNISVWIVGPDDIKLEKKFVAHQGIISQLELSKAFFSSSSVEESEVKIWSLDDFSQLTSIKLDCFGTNAFCRVGGNSGETNGISYFVAGTDYNMQLTKAHLKLSEEHHANVIAKHPDWIKCVAVSTSSAEVATGSIDGTIIVWDSNTGKMQRVLTCEAYKGHLFVFSVDGKCLLSRVGAWDAQTGERVPYLDIKKENRNPLKKDFNFTPLHGYMNLVELSESIVSGSDQEETAKSPDGVCFSCDSADQVLRTLLPVSEFRPQQMAVCCSGTSVHFLQVIS